MTAHESAQPAAAPVGPMRGVRVVDLSIALTGPYAVALLADQGADVIKVERPTGDVARYIGVDVNGMAALFLSCNRGKRSIAVDLRHPDGIDVVRRLAADADVVVQNFRPGVVDRLGVGYEQIREINPDVIYASLSGFGSTGPYRDRSAYDTVIQAYAGVATNQADPDDGIPQFLRQTVADKVTALYAAQAISAALFARERGTGGQHIEMSMVDAVVSFLWADAAANEVLLDADHSRPSSFVSDFPPFRFADGWGIVTPTTERDFAGMCRAFGVDGWDDPRLATMATRNENPEYTMELVTKCYASAERLTTGRATELLEAERVPFAMVLRADQLPDDPHAIAMGLFELGEHPIVGRTRLPRHPAQFHGTPSRLGFGAPGLGEHTDAVLTELGLGDRIEELRRGGVVA